MRDLLHSGVELFMYSISPKIIFFILITVFPVRAMELVIQEHDDEPSIFIDLNDFEQIPFPLDQSSKSQIFHDETDNIRNYEPNWRPMVFTISCCCGCFCWVPGGVMWS